MTADDAIELARLVRIYLPPGPARQMVGDLMRSKAARDNAALHATMRAVFAVLAAGTTQSADDYRNEVQR